ncbi:MAG: hypothetical protein M3279_05265 [Actinomycetota bacterium]|nr:hypothetical protein [Actinomycetota bacterium]
MSNAIAVGLGGAVGFVVKKWITQEVETTLRRNGVDPRVAPYVAAGLVALGVWAIKK